MEKKFFGIDLGGTKIASGVISQTGRILTEWKEPVDLSRGPSGLFRQMTRIFTRAKTLHPTIEAAGIASAGPLDPLKGRWLDPTNFFTGNKSWGAISVTSPLQKLWRIPVVLENDAAASTIAEAWVGAGKKHANFMVLTLGTGLGTGIFANGELVRSGRHLHPEAGHIILSAHDPSARCGCGQFGCAEAFLSGVNFSGRFNKFYRKKKQALHGEEIAALAKKGDSQAKKAFLEYSRYLAIALHNYVVLYSPEVFIFGGSFAAASANFLPETRKQLPALLERRRAGIDLLPKLLVSPLGNSSGIIGAARAAQLRFS